MQGGKKQQLCLKGLHQASGSIKGKGRIMDQIELSPLSDTLTGRKCFQCAGSGNLKFETKINNCV